MIFLNNNRYTYIIYTGIAAKYALLWVLCYPTVALYIRYQQINLPALPMPIHSVAGRNFMR